MRFPPPDLNPCWRIRDRRERRPTGDRCGHHIPPSLSLIEPRVKPSLSLIEPRVKPLGTRTQWSKPTRAERDIRPKQPCSQGSQVVHSHTTWLGTRQRNLEGTHPEDPRWCRRHILEPPHVVWISVVCPLYLRASVQGAAVSDRRGWEGDGEGGRQAGTCRRRPARVFRGR